MKRASARFQEEQGTQETYSLSANQTEAIVVHATWARSPTSNARNCKVSTRKLLDALPSYLHLLVGREPTSGPSSGEEMDDLKQKFPAKRRTEITDEELTDVDKDELIAEEPMVVTLSQRGYVKRTPLSVYQAQNRGGKGIKGAKTDEEDPIEHLFVTSTHSYLLFFTNYGKVYWQKVYDLPLQARTAKGRGTRQPAASSRRTNGSRTASTSASSTTSDFC